MSKDTVKSKRRSSPKPNRLRLIPEELKQTGDRFVCFRYEGERRRPRNPVSDHLASPTDPKTWVDFDTAYAGVSRGEYEEVHFVVSDKDEIIALDLDGCRNPKNKSVHQWAEQILDRLKPYPMPINRSHLPPHRACEKT